MAAVPADADALPVPPLVERPQPAKRHGTSQQRYLQAGFARHLRDIAPAYPATQSPRAVLVVDKASWHKGTMIGEVLGAFPHLALYPLPNYSSPLQAIERFRKALRGRATHDRLFQTMAHLKQAWRNSLRYYQTLKHRVLSLIPSPKKRTRSSGL
jgi:transposase